MLHYVFLWRANEGHRCLKRRLRGSSNGIGKLNRVVQRLLTRMPLYSCLLLLIILRSQAHASIRLLTHNQRWIYRQLFLQVLLLICLLQIHLLIKNNLWPRLVNLNLRRTLRYCKDHTISCAIPGTFTVSARVFAIVRSEEAVLKGMNWQFSAVGTVQWLLSVILERRLDSAIRMRIVGFTIIKPIEPLLFQLYLLYLIITNEHLTALAFDLVEEFLSMTSYLRTRPRHHVLLYQLPVFPK